MSWGRWKQVTLEKLSSTRSSLPWLLTESDLRFWTKKMRELFCVKTVNSMGRYVKHDSAPDSPIDFRWMMLQLIRWGHAGYEIVLADVVQNWLGGENERVVTACVSS